MKHLLREKLTACKKDTVIERCCVIVILKTWLATEMCGRLHTHFTAGIVCIPFKHVTLQKETQQF